MITNNNDKCGVHRLSCNDYNKLNIGQSGQSFTERFKEHLTSHKYNKIEFQVQNT